MELSKEKIESILKTLPIGYYCKRALTVELSADSDTSFYVPMLDKIVISYKTIFNSLLKCTAITEEKLEQTVRTLLYHETSHALLTPQRLEIDDIINIFEDERIESILRNFYHGTNFREFVKEVNHYHGEKPTNAFSEFYQTVRYRVGKPQHLAKVHELIMKYYDYTRETPNWKTWEYIRDIKQLFADIKDDWLSKTENDEDNSIVDNVDNINIENNELFDENEEQSMSNEIISKVINCFTDNAMIADITTILSKSSKMTQRNGSAVNAYSGVFDPRSVIRDDYKYFIQQNRLGHVKAFAKTHLNLFIDCSGSFYNSENTVNKLLYALSLFEKRNANFSYDLICCTVGQKIEDRAHRQISCNGGNWLDAEIFEQFKKMQFPEHQNVNIVLFDGDAFTNTPRMNLAQKRREFVNFKAFDTTNTTIISDKSNAEYITNNCTKAKVIITTDYANKLYEHVIQALDRSTR